MEWIVIVILVIAVVLFILYKTPVTPVVAKVDSNAAQIEQEGMISLYGELTKEIKYGYYTMDGITYKGNTINGKILCFENSQIIIINDKPFSFDSILGCDLIINNTVAYSSHTKTSTGNMIGRAVVGSVLMGGVGAILGGATAKKETVNNQMERSTYKVYVNINDLSNPQICIDFFFFEKEARETASLLSIIIERNDRKR